MKKVFFASLMALLFISCGNTYHYDGATLKTISLQIAAHHWMFDKCLYYVDRSMPQITREVFDKGVVNVYLVRNGNSYETAYKNPLPYVVPLSENDSYYFETVDFEYGVGWIRFYYTTSDFIYPTSPSAMDFDVVITYPQD